MRNYIELTDIFPDRIEMDRYIVDKFTLTDYQLEEIKNQWHPKRFEKYGDSLIVGKEYVILYDKSQSKVMMTNNEFEMITNQKFIDNAKGDVIIFGLGIGLILYPLLQDDGIKSITIIEVDKDLIDETFPIILNSDTKSKLSIINCDAFQYEDDKKYDTIYFDIWPLINEEAFKEMKVLSERFSKNLNEGGWMDSWCSEEESY
jgi:spermidine synthase